VWAPWIGPLGLVGHPDGTGSHGLFWPILGTFFARLWLIFACFDYALHLDRLSHFQTHALGPDVTRFCTMLPIFNHSLLIFTVPFT
jgi:hypothetical protein